MIALDPNFSVTRENRISSGAVVHDGDGFEFAELGDEGLVEVGLSVFDFERFDEEAFEGGDLGACGVASQRNAQVTQMKQAASRDFIRGRINSLS